MDKLIITDGLTDVVLAWIHKNNVIDIVHEQDKPSGLETLEFTALADKAYARHLGDMNRVLVPDEDGRLREMYIVRAEKYRNSDGVLLIDVLAYASYQTLKKSKSVAPHKTTSEMAIWHVNQALAGTEFQAGEIAHTGLRAINFENNTDPFQMIKTIANRFELEYHFYVEIRYNKIVARKVDLVDQIGDWRGRLVEFGRDLKGIRRIEDASEVVTALRVIGPENSETGERMEVVVEDEDARKRWGRKGQHIIEVYEPSTSDEDITPERLETLGSTELDKRINLVVEFEGAIVDLEHVTGLENKRIRFGDEIRIKDTTFEPALYLKARIFNVKRNPFNPADKSFK